MRQLIDTAFSDTVKGIQTSKGSRSGYEKMAARGAWSNVITPDVRQFIENQSSAFLGTVSADGQPYIQHRGGPRGFLRVLDEHTIAFADYKGNRQYISQGNLRDNANAFLFLLDYSAPARLKLWGEAKVIEDNPALLAELMPRDYKARAEQIVTFRVTLWDFNCRQHLPHMLPVSDVEQLVSERDQRIQELEATVEALQCDI